MGGATGAAAELALEFGDLGLDLLPFGFVADKGQFYQLQLTSFIGYLL